MKFGKNYVSVTTAGAQYVTLARFGGEKYEFAPKCLPDMVVRNVVIGTKYIMWEGDITLSCPHTGCVSTLFGFDDAPNVPDAYVQIFCYA